MDKLRFPLALLLSFVILIGWSQFFGPSPVQETIRTPGAGAPADGGAAATEPVPPAPTPEPVGDEVRATERWQEWLELGRSGEPGHYWARFDNRGGTISELRLDKYYVASDLDPAAKDVRENWEPLLVPIDTGERMTRSFVLRASSSSQHLVREPLDEVLWVHEVLRGPDGAVQGVHFTHAPGTGVIFEKTIRLVAGAWELELEVGVRTLNPEHSGPRQFVLTPAECVPQASEDTFYIEPQAVVARRDRGDIDLDVEGRKDSGGALTGSLGGGDIVFGGVHNKYFAVLLRGADPDSSAGLLAASWRRVRDAERVRQDPSQAGKAWSYITTDLDLVLHVSKEAEATTRRTFLVYAGPKNPDVMAADFPPHRLLSEKDLGFFATIARSLLAILAFFHSLTGNWGWAIILLTLTVRTVLFPLNRRSQTAMSRHQTKMKRIQPRLNEIKQRYAKDPSKLRQEQARIMQEEGAFPPLGGCLPIFVQIPIFFGLFQALRTSFDMRQAPFMLWIKDLSAPDRLLRLDLDTHLPFVGTIEYLNILPILMVVLWILQQKVMPKPTDEQALRMQKMMMWMPILFGVFLYNYAAGLSLYMITTSTFGILEQTVIKKAWPLDTREKPKKKSGFMARMMELSEKAQKMQEVQRQQQGGRGRKKAGGRKSR